MRKSLLVKSRDQAPVTVGEQSQNVVLPQTGRGAYTFWRQKIKSVADIRELLSCGEASKDRGHLSVP